MKQYQPTPDFYHDYISHHGILGQQWGVRNGPPYPLGSDISTGKSLKKKKPKKSETVYRGSNNKLFGKDKEIKKVEEAASSNQDTFNDVLDRIYIDGESYADTGYFKLIEDVAAEEGVDKREFINAIEDSYFKRLKDMTAEEAKKITDKNLLTDEKINPYDKRSIEAAKLGLTALNKVRYDDQDPNNKSSQFWFLVEDQTIGLPLIADLVNQGKSKQEIMDMYETANKPAIYKSHWNDPGFFEFGEVDEYELSPFIDACIDAHKSNKKNKR